MARLAEWVALGKTVARVTHESDVKYLATSVAYYAFVSFVPLLVLVVAVFGERLANDLIVVPARFVTPDTQRLIAGALTSASGRTWAALLSLAVFAWGGGNVAAGFLRSVQRIETTAGRSLVVRVRDAVVVLASVVLAILAVVLQSLLPPVLSAGPLGTVLGLVALVVVLTAVFLPLYYLPSRVVTSVPAALPGAVTTACGWTALHVGLRFYATNAAQFAIYGVLSGVILLLTGAYVAAILLMIGAVVNAVLATRTDDRPVAGGRGEQIT